MRWYCLPQFVRDVGGSSNPSANRLGVWLCPERGMAAFFRSSLSTMVLAPVGAILPGVKVDGSRLDPQPTLYGGETWYASSAGILFRSIGAIVDRGWVFMESSNAPHEPRQDEDYFYGVFNVASAQITTFAAGGTASGIVTVARDWPRYEKSAATGAGLSPLGGTWTPYDGISEDPLVIGTPGWRRVLHSSFAMPNLAFIKPDDPEADVFAPVTDAKIVMANDLDPDDPTGDYVFTDVPRVRLRAAPSAGVSQSCYTLDPDGTTYHPAGSFTAAVNPIVPTIPSPSYLGASPAVKIKFAEPALWQL